jgi:hypothetical protein
VNTVPGDYSRGEHLKLGFGPLVNNGSKKFYVAGARTTPTHDWGGRARGGAPSPGVAHRNGGKGRVRCTHTYSHLCTYVAGRQLTQLTCSYISLSLFLSLSLSLSLSIYLPLFLPVSLWFEMSQSAKIQTQILKGERKKEERGHKRTW